MIWVAAVGDFLVVTLTVVRGLRTRIIVVSF